MFDLDVTLVRNVYFESDTTGVHTKINESANGLVTFEKAKLQLDEKAFFELVSSSGSGGKSAQVDNKTRNSVLTVGSDVFAWKNAFVQKNYKNGKPSDPNAWSARGHVTKNGQPFYQYKLDAQNIGSRGGFIRVELGSQNEKRVMEVWPAY